VMAEADAWMKKSQDKEAQLKKEKEDELKQ
jgi:hypothetical protein